MSGSGIEEGRPVGQASVEAQYRAVRTGVGLFDLVGNGLLRVTGKNAIPFLHGLVSNEVRTLEVGEGVLAAFPTLQGKLLALARIYRIEGGVLLEVEASNREKVLRNLSRFVLAGEFWIEDLSEAWCGLALEGPGVEQLLGAVAEGWRVEEEKPLSRRLVITQIGGVEVWAAAHRRCGEPGYDLFLPREVIEGIRERLLAVEVPFPVLRIDVEVFEMARIEAGVPREGQDAGEEYILLETGLGEAISYEKGCYLGQEVIARIHWRGQPARQLRGILPEMSEAGGVPPVGTELYATDGSLTERKIGQITSATWSLGRQRPIALGYVHRYYLTPGTTVELKQGETTLGRGEVTDLPFTADRKG
ncbi:MAG: YgfZ/GcvT domain-containing protein [Blastocatellia bacterium]